MKFLNTILSLVIAGGMLSFAPDNGVRAIPEVQANDRGASSESSSLVDEDDDGYLGYGFNMTDDKKISEPTALKLSNPILDVGDPTIRENVRSFGSSQTTYESASCSSAREVASNLGILFNGGLDIPIQVVKVDLNLEFSMDNSFSQISQQEFSYYDIYVKNRTVTLQLSDEEIRGLLSDRFREDLYAVRSENDAVNLFNKYGTHLLRGYVLGGIFEMTNYFASDQTDYVREISLGFDGQVGVAIGSADAGGEFSFDATYGTKDNNSHAVNKYKCSTYGGKTFPGLTIDQAFQWYEGALNGKYVYQIWTDSINAGEHLVIVDVPDSASFMPLWDLLPLSSNYNTARTTLKKVYADLCDEAYGSYLDANADIYPTDLNDKNNPDASLPGIESIGFDYSLPVGKDSNRMLTSYVQAEPNNATSYQIEKGSEVTLNVNCDSTLNDGLIYSINYPDFVEDFDRENGYFRVSEDAPTNTRLVVTVATGDYDLCQIAFSVSDGFSGGDGTAEHPFLLKDYGDLQKLSSSPMYWDSHYNFRLVDDIDCNFQALSSIGNSNKPFAGTFDGNYYSIRNYAMDLSDAASTGDAAGIFGHNSGVIKNLWVENDAAVMGSYQARYNLEMVGKSNYIVNYIGGVVGVNDSHATIQNVHVKNINMYVEYQKEYSKDGSFVDKAYMGGIVGLNHGAITDSTIEASRLLIRGDYVSRVLCGGVAALSDGDDIERSGTSNCAIYARSGVVTSGSDQHAIAGGLVAELDAGALRDALVSDIAGTADNETNSRLISLARGTSSSKNLLSACGGLVGYAKQGTSVSKVIINNVKTVQSNYYVTDGGTPDSVIKTHSGRLFGHFDGADDAMNRIKDYLKDSEGLAANVYVDMSNDLPDFASMSIPKGDSISGYNNITKFVGPSESGVFLSSVWGMDDNGDPYLIEVRPTDNASSYIFSGMKTEFLVGERFSLGEVTVSGSTNNGDDFTLTEYQVDYSAFRSDVPGNYIIKLYAYGIEYSYVVTVSKAEAVALEMEEEPTKTEYYEREEFDPTGMVLEVVYENGRRRELGPGEYEMSDTKLENGVNTITFTYKEGDATLTYDYYVVGETRTVASIEILTLPDVTAYTIGATEIATDGMTVEVTYEDGGTEIVDGSECELIFGTVAEGENTVVVAYNGYKTDSFTITGKPNVDQAEVDAFITLVDSIEGASTLSVKDSLIAQALTLKEEIGLYFGDDFAAASEKLDELIAAYDEEVASINGDFGATFPW